MKEVKTGVIIINESFIKKHIVQPRTPYTYEYITAHLRDDDIKEMIYPYYIKWKLADNMGKMNSIQWSMQRYNFYFDIVPIENINIIFAKTKEEWKEFWKNIKKKKAESELENKILESRFVKTKELFVCHENLKFHISANKLNHQFEFFKTRYEGSFFSMVSKFHLPCVRGFYNGKDVKLLPSCISAAMTLINIDYKYFAGSKDPIEIINKYRSRGYTTLLNDKEKIRLVEYSKMVSKWNKLYGNFNINKQSEIESILGYIDVNKQFFEPRKVIPEEYTTVKPVLPHYKKSNLKSTNKYGYVKLMKTFYTSLKCEPITFSKDLRCINKNGYINCIKKWYLDAIYDLC